MLPCYEQRVTFSKMGTPYSNGTTFPPENGEVKTEGEQPNYVGR